MLNLRLPLLVLCFLGGLGHPALSDAQDPITTTVQPYFAALKSGDVAALKALVGGDHYRQLSVLLEHNTDYPAFLRQHYAPVQFHIDAVITQPSGIAVKTRYAFSANDIQRHLLIVQPDANGKWKIMGVREIDE